MQRWRHHSRLVAVLAGPVAAGSLLGYLLALIYPAPLDRREGQSSRDGIEIAVPLGRSVDSSQRTADTDRLRTLAGISDKELLGDMLAVATNGTGAGTEELVSILHRLADIDPLGAVRRSIENDAALDIVSLAFRRLAEVDIEAALDELVQVTDPLYRREVSLALLEVIGDRTDGIEHIASKLPRSEAVMFKRDAIARLAETDPAEALLMAIEWASTSDTFGRLALNEVARVAARLDPRSAMANSMMISADSAAASYRSVLANEWSRLDPLSYLEYLQSAPLEQLVAGDFSAVAAVDAEGLLKVAETLPPSLSGRAREAAFGALAEQDLASTLRRMDTIPAGRDRDAVVGVIAEAYGQRDIYGALEWAKSQYRPSSVMQRAVRGLVTVNADLALEIAADESTWPGPRDSLFLSSLVSSAITASANASGVVERIRALGDEALLSQAVQLWSQHDVDAAISWSLAGINELRPETVQDLAANFAARAPQQAQAQASSIGLGQREHWIRGVATGLSYSDGKASMDWLAQFAGESFYDEAANEVLQRWSNQMPESAAAMLTTVSPYVQRQSAPAVGTAWARTAPEAAAAWALELDDQDSRVSAMGSVLATWSLSNSASAKRWLDRNVADVELRRRIEEQLTRQSDGRP